VLLTKQHKDYLAFHKESRFKQRGNNMDQLVDCPKCGTKAKGTGVVSCLCDKDFCHGDRCLANQLSKNYECDCGKNGIPPQTQSYYDRHCN